MQAIQRRSVGSIAVLAAALVVAFAFSAVAKAAPGDLDPSFSKDGKQTTDDGGGWATGMAIQPDGKIVAAGSDGKGFALARYNPNGSLDTSFSKDGKQTTEFVSGAGALGVALQRDGKIVVVGDTNSGGGDFALARYNPNGSLDKSFSGDGKLTTNFGGDPREGGDGATAVAIQGNGNGRIVVAGWSAVGSYERSFALARYNPDGSLDRSFSGDGKLTTDFYFPGQANGVAVHQPNGRIVAVGYVGSSFALARYNPDGSLDRSFSGDGKQETVIGPFANVANAVALQANGVIIAVGRGGGGGSNFALARYNPNGSLDQSFSKDGKQETDFGNYDGANGMAIQADGKIVAAGFGGQGFALARYNQNGSPDKTFAGDGKLTTDFGGDSGASGVAIQADGKIVAAGGSGGTGGNDRFALARYLGG